MGMSQDDGSAFALPAYRQATYLFGSSQGVSYVMTTMLINTIKMKILSKAGLAVTPLHQARCVANEATSSVPWESMGRHTSGLLPPFIAVLSRSAATTTVVC